MIRVLLPALRKTGEQKQLVALAGRRHRRDCPVLRCRTDVGPAYALVDGRVLAVVGRAFVGRGVLRGLRHDGHRLRLHATESDSTRRRGRGGAAVGHDLSLGRHHRHLPSPVLFRHADRGPGLGIGLQCPGSRAAGAGRLRRHGRPAALQNFALGSAIQVADLFLRRGGVLEYGRAPGCSAS